MDRIVLGTRGSDLALAQAAMVEEGLRSIGFGGEIERKIVKTSGDKRLDIRLSEFAVEGVLSQGAFTKELEEALLAGEVDCAVHSMKDLPSRLGASFAVAAVLPRAPVEDVLVTREPDVRAFADLAEGATLATGSVRRERIALWRRPDLKLSDIRGNVPTRLRKLAGGEAGDATLLARAGLERLGFFAEGSRSIRIDGRELGCATLPTDEFIPAGGQGAVAIEVLADSPALRLLGGLDHAQTSLEVGAERRFLFALGAGCDTPVGVHATAPGVPGGELGLAAIVFEGDDPGANPRQGVQRIAVSDDRESPLVLADRLLAELGFDNQCHD